MSCDHGPPGWFIDWRAVLVLCLLGITSLMLGIGSGIYALHVHARSQRAAAVIDSLSQGHWVRVRSGDTVVTVIRGRTWRFPVQD